MASRALNITRSLAASRGASLRSAVRVVLLGAVFLGLFQPFYYLIDFYRLYVVAKAIFPAFALAFGYVLMLAFLLTRSAYPYTTTIVGAFLYLVITAALASKWNFDQSLFYGLTAETKLIPLAFYFFALFLFRRFAVQISELDLVLALLAWSTVLIGAYLKFFVDPSSVANEHGILVLYDEIRGYRYNLPLVFIELYALIAFRKAAETRSVIAGAQVAFFLIYLFWIAEQRTSVFGLVAVMLIATLTYGAIARTTIMLVCLLLAAALFHSLSTSYFAFATIAAALQFRLNTAATIVSFLGDDPARWLFGAGNLSPLAGTTLQDIYGQNFWPADVGWVGVLFEFGILGVIVIVGMYVLLWRESERYATHTHPYLLLGLKDYVRKMILLSILIPVVPFLSGVFATLLALVVYYRSSGGGNERSAMLPVKL